MRGSRPKGSADRISVRFVAVLLALAGAGCASVPRTEPARARDEILVQSAVASAATQVRRCYRKPRVASQGLRIITQLRVRVFPGGEVRGLPVVLGQHGVTPANQVYAQQMAEAAIGAVVRCAPLSLPEGVYRYGWVDIDLTFSPMARA